MSYVPCAFNLSIATSVSSQVKILLLRWCFLNNFLKVFPSTHFILEALEG